MDIVKRVHLHGTNGAGRVKRVNMDSVSGSLTMISHEHHEIHEGSTFRSGDSLVLGDGGVQNYLITTPDTAKWAHLKFHGDGTAVTTFEAFEGADRVGSVLLPTLNVNRNLLNVNTTLIHKGYSLGTTDGSQIFKYSSGTATNQSRSESGYSESVEWVLKQNTKYILRVTSGTAANLINIVLDWYEHESETYL